MAHHEGVANGCSAGTALPIALQMQHLPAPEPVHTEATTSGGRLEQQAARMGFVCRQVQVHAGDGQWQWGRVLCIVQEPVYGAV